MGILVALAENLQEEKTVRGKWPWKEPGEGAAIQGGPAHSSFAKDSTRWQWDFTQKEIFESK